MPSRRPPPFKPLGAVARSALPGQRERRPSPAVVDVVLPGDVPDLVASHSRTPVVTITAEITLPQSTGYARRLNNLLRALRSSLEEEAPWLSNIEIQISVPKT